MSTTVKFELQIETFKTPDHVVETASPVTMVPPMPGTGPALTPRMFKLSEVPVETLDFMCSEFRREVFKKAGHSAPRPPTKKLIVSDESEVIQMADNEIAVFSYPGGQWINPKFEPPEHDEVYQVFNGTRHIARFTKTGWRLTSTGVKIEDVMFYTESAPVPVPQPSTDELDSWGPSA